MARVHLITVGASIAENYARKYPEDAWIVQVDSELEKRAYPGNELFQRALNLVRESPRDFSAELNAMNFYLSRKMVDEVYLYHTATGKGKFCAAILEAYLQERGIRVNLVELKRLTTPNKVDMTLLEQIFEDGLVDLLDKVMSKAHELVEEGHEVYVNATGGLKPEAAMLPLASSLLPKPVRTYYIHERFSEAISLPSLPLAISPRYQEVLRWLDEQRRMKGFATQKEFEDRWGLELLKDLLDRKLVIDDEGRIKLRGWTLVLLKRSP